MLALAIKGRFDPATTLMLVLLGAALGVVGRDSYLSRQVHQREARIRSEFPTIADMLALAVSAGESSAGALDRVCRSGHGDFVNELSKALADTRVGAPLNEALTSLSDRVAVASVARFVDGLVVAMERGTPLAEVLRAQAQDVRGEGRRELIESGGKREIAMMVPVVFLILPITIVFALFPGVSFLSLTL